MLRRDDVIRTDRKNWAQGLFYSLGILIFIAALSTLSAEARAGCRTFPELLRAKLAGLFAEWRPITVIDENSVENICYRLGLPSDQVIIQSLSEGGMNKVYLLTSRDPVKPVHFPYASIIDPELRGKRIDNYVLKSAKPHVTHWLSQRDASTLTALKKAISYDVTKYEGIHLANTYLVSKDSDGPRLVIQERTNGKELYDVLKSYLEPVLGECRNHDDYVAKAKRLFAHLIESDLRGDSVDNIFSAKNLTPKSGGPLFASPTAMYVLRQAWTADPTLQRIRHLMKQLFKLSRSFELSGSNLAAHLRLKALVNEMPWSTGRDYLPRATVLDAAIDKSKFLKAIEVANGDFGYKNFFLDQDEHGTWFLVLVDF